MKDNVEGFRELRFIFTVDVQVVFGNVAFDKTNLLQLCWLNFSDAFENLRVIVRNLNAIPTNGTRKKEKSKRSESFSSTKQKSCVIELLKGGKAHAKKKSATMHWKCTTFFFANTYNILHIVLMSLNWTHWDRHTTNVKGKRMKVRREASRKKRQEKKIFFSL